jgi:hypothetical protein
MITVVARVDQAFFRQADNQPATDPPDHCMITVNFTYTDGTNTGGGSTFALFPISFSQRQANRYIRERVAASVLAIYSTAIDPEDIYIPLS